MKQDRQRGFSLPELLIVVSILGVVAIAAVHQVQKTMMTYRLETAATLLSSSLTEGRLTALKYNKTTTVKLNATARTIEIWSLDPNNQAIQMKTSVPLPTGIYLNTSSPTQVSFNSLGRNTGGSTILTFWENGSTDAKCVSVSAVGIVSTAWC